MERWLGKYSEEISALMRVVVGEQSRLSDPKSLTAGVIEFVGGGLVALGLFARFAAFLVIA